ncbi:MAG: hypothetical protein JNJ62_13250 [Pseudoxanthomonas mexicana]|nr:hypothetical protein [Pseudoxanthomonas mexicana]
MFIARSIYTLTLILVLASAKAGEPAGVLSDPESWEPLLGLPPGTERCPGGEMATYLEHVPQLQPQAPAEYEVRKQVSLSYVDGLEPTDTLYPFYFQIDPPGSRFFGLEGFFVVRDGCIVHVQPTTYDN